MKGYIGFCSAWHERCVALFRVSFKEYFNLIQYTSLYLLPQSYTSLYNIVMILSFSNSEIRECVSSNKSIWSIIINTIWDIRPCTKKEGRNNKTNYKTKRTRHSFHLIYIWYRRIKTLSKNFSLEMQWIQSTLKFL